MTIAFLRLLEILERFRLLSNLVFPDRTDETILIASKFENGNTNDTIDVWPEYGDFGIDKENFLENSIFYIIQGYQSVKDNKRIYNGDYFFIGLVNEWAKPSMTLSPSYIMVRGDPE